MKLILILGILFSTFAWGQSWPQSMYTTERLFEEQFSPMRTYIRNLKINYPYKQLKNKLVFFSDNGDLLEEIFKLIVKREQTENYIKETIIFDGRWGAKEKFVYERWGEFVRPLDTAKLTSFNFTMPRRVSAYRIEFQQQKVYQHVEFLENKTQSNYRLFDYGLEIHHIEEIQEQRLYSKLWYQCDVCSGEPLIAVMDTRDTHMGNMSYFYGNPLKFVTPKEFFSKANRSYLSGIYREFGSISMNGVFMYGWPQN